MDVVEESTRRSSGVAKAGLATGITGLSLAELEILGKHTGGYNTCAPMCSEDYYVNRYEFDLQLANANEIQNKDLEIARLNTEVKLRDANTYTDQKLIELYKYFESQIGGNNANLGQQAVQNKTTKDGFQLIQKRLCGEVKERKCADNMIINYVNATFYLKMIADVTTGSITTAQSLYNPLPIDCCC